MKENAVKKISRIQNLRKHLFEHAKIQRGHSPNKLEAKKIPLQESRELDRATIVQTLDDLNLAANTFGEYLASNPLFVFVVRRISSRSGKSNRWKSARKRERIGRSGIVIGHKVAVTGCYEISHYLSRLLVPAGGSGLFLPWRRRR